MQATLPQYAIPKQRDDRGSMLIVALGILALLSILALTFVKLMTLERAASTNYVDGVRARLVAEGGLESALAQIKRDVTATPYSDITEGWVYAEGQYWLPLEESTSIRARSKEEQDSPRSQSQLDKRRASFAGLLGNTYAQGIGKRPSGPIVDQEGGDRYKIKVLDAQTQFNLNSNYEESEVNGKTYDLAYIRFLDALGVAISKRSTPGSTTPSGINPILRARYPRGEPNAYRGGMAIYQFRRTREGGEFRSKTELLEVLESEDHYTILKDYVTTKSWMDTRVVSPVSIPTQRKKPWGDVDHFEPRSPINVNLASKAILAANLAGIAGRAIFLYAGDWATRDQRLSAIDVGTKFTYTAPSGADIREANFYDPKGVVVYFDSFGYQGKGPGAADPPIIDGAYRFADMIWQRVQTNPFRSFAEWEKWLDTNLGPGVLSWSDTGGRKVFPRHDASTLVITDLGGTPLSQTAKQDIKADPRFEAWFYDCVRSMIKANMNPNARLSGWNPDAVVAMPIDKGGLLYMDPRLQYGDPNKELRRRQTNEWCFAPQGVFEVIALGEVLGDAPEQLDQRVDKNDDGLKDAKVFAQAKVRGIIQLFEVASHRTQRDFESGGGPEIDGGHSDYRSEISSYPVPKIYWDPRAHNLTGSDLVNFYKKWRHAKAPGNLVPSDRSGYLQLSTLVQDSTKGTASTAVVDMAMLNDATPPHFELLLQDRRVELPGQNRNTNLDPLQADTSSKQWNNTRPGQPATGRVKNRWGYPYLESAPGRMNYGHFWDGTSPMDGENIWQSLVLTPDGYLNSVLRPSTLWYRASDSGLRSRVPKEEFIQTPGQDTELGNGLKYLAGLDPKKRGASQLNINTTGTSTSTTADVGGNVAPTPKGGVSFWYKPEFDWASRSSTGSYIQDTSVPGKNKQDQRFCGLIGVSHIFRNKDAFSGPATAPKSLGSWCRGTQMFVSRTTSGDLRITRLFFEAGGQPPDLNNPPTPPYTGVLEQPWVADPAGGPRMPISIYWKKCTQDPQYTWPPLELLETYKNLSSPWRSIAKARTDWWVPRDNMQHWLAHEWHHIAVRWDDEANTLMVWLDTENVSNTLRKNPIGDPYLPVGSYDPTSSPPGAIVPPVGFGPTDTVPGFVRVNANMGGDDKEDANPKDMITVGSIWRDQDQRAGLFKIAQKTNLPANGTIDDVRFWDGLGGSNRVSFVGHYERDGGWENEFDLSQYFPADTNQLKLGAIQFTAYLPTEFGARRAGAQEISRAPSGAGAVTLTFRVMDSAGNVRYDFPSRWIAVMDSIDGQSTSTGFQLTDDQGEPVTVSKTDKLVYELEIESAKYQNGQGLTPGVGAGFAVASPVVDSISLTYLLPNPKLLLKERVNQ